MTIVNDNPLLEGPSCENSHNSVYQPSGEERKFRYIYFYYLKERDEDNSAHPSEFDTETYFLSFPQPVGMDPVRIHSLVALADLGLISPVGWKVLDLRWRKKAHLVFVLRHSQSRLSSCNAVTFQEAQTNENHSFRDGKDIVPLGDISGMYCANIRMSRSGCPIKDGDDETYKITVNTGPVHNNHNDQGQNTGP